MSSIDRYGNIGANNVNFSPTSAPSSIGTPGIAGTGVSGAGQQASPSGDCKLGGPVIVASSSASDGSITTSGEATLVMDPVFSAEDQMTAEMVAEISGAVFGSPVERMSINDMMTELMIMMLKFAVENKSTEREMRAELATVQFQNGLKMAEMIEKRGQMAFQKAITQAVTQLVAATVDVAKTATIEAVVRLKEDSKGSSVDTSSDAVAKRPDRDLKFKTQEERQSIRDIGNSLGGLARTLTETTGNLIAAQADVGMSKLDAQTKVMETMNRLIDNIMSSIDSSIRSQDSAIQFAMNMLQQLNSLAHEGCSKIINNMR